jgi:cell division control protein 24
MTPLSASQSHQQVPTQASFAAANDASTSSQLRVKVYCNAVSQILTLVVPTTISYASLKDRIDAKLQRSTNLSLGDRGPKENQVKLKYLDEDDYVSIQSDEDVQTAFEAWKEAHGHAANADGGFGMGGLLGEIELFCQK